MKKNILIFTKGLLPEEITTLRLGLDKVVALLPGLTFTYEGLHQPFNSIPFSNDVAKGYLLDNTQILQYVKNDSFDIACLFYDWTLLTPQPTNPATTLIKKGNCIPMAIPKQWYNGDVDVLVQFFLHELSHAEHWRYGVKDITHDFYSSQFSQVPGTGQRDFYLFLLKRIWDNAPGVITIPVPTFYSLKFGSFGSRVNQLQKNLGTLGYFKYPSYTSFFGLVTKKAVMAFQLANGLKADGIYGPVSDQAMQEALKKKPSINKLDAWALAIQEFEGFFPGSRSYRNNNPGNIKYVGQSNVGKDDKGFCIFPDYATGLAALKALLKRAASGGSKYYNANGSLYDFYNVYAPSSDNNHPNLYAEYVAKRIGVDPDTIISTLIN
jgi:peptidoglycan hydrolase-like protein with peptidoglycan-binding domain